MPLTPQRSADTPGSRHPRYQPRLLNPNMCQPRLSGHPPSPTRGCAPPSSTGSPSTPTSSPPAPTPTGCAPPKPGTRPPAPDPAPPRRWPMTLISQPGSNYQIASISLDAGYTRDLILMLIDVHAVLDHLYLDGTQPQITSPAEDYLLRIRQPLHPARPHRRSRRGHRPPQPRRTPSARRHPARPARLRTSQQQPRRQLLTRRSPAPQEGPDQRRTPTPAPLNAGPDQRRTVERPRRFRTAETVFSKPLPAMPGTRCGPPAEAGTRLPSEDASDCNAVRCSAQYHAWPFRGSDRLCGTRALS